VASRELEAGLAALEGRVDDAAAIYGEVLREHESMGTVFDRAVCQIGMVAVLPPDHRLSRLAADEARATLAELRAAPYLDRLDEMLAGAVASPGAEARQESRETAPRLGG
jgi:hypothetical protein